MATTRNDRLRRDIGATVQSLPDTAADDIFTEAEEDYGDNTRVQRAAARVIALTGMLGSAAKLTTYEQHNTLENVSDITKHLKQLLDLWEARLAAAIAAAEEDVTDRVSSNMSISIPTQAVW